MSDPARLPPDDVLETLPISAWHGPCTSELQEQAVRALEARKMLFLPRLAFQATAEEAPVLTGAQRVARARMSASTPPWAP